MKVIFFIAAISWNSFGCNRGNETNCYPKESVARTVILVADTTIMHRGFVPENDTIETYPVLFGVGFVKRDGTPVHKPLMTLVLSERQQKDFLKILRPIPNLDKGTITNCIPIYRHAVLFYDKVNQLIGQMHICFDCGQVNFRPEPDCLNLFDNVRFNEIENFFEKNNIPRM